jgi:hypothetical protein
VANSNDSENGLTLFEALAPIVPQLKAPDRSRLMLPPAGKLQCPESRYAGPVGSSYQIDTVIEDGSKLPPLADW